MVLVAIDRAGAGRRVVLDVGPGDVVYVGRNPLHGAAPPEAGAKMLRIPWADRVVNRHHSVARIGDGHADLELCAPPEGDGPRSPFVRTGSAGVEILERARLAEGETIGVGKGARTMIALASDAEHLDRHRPISVDGVPAGPHDSVEGVPHAVRVQLRLFQEELPRKLAGWRSVRELCDGAAGFLELAARNLGADRSVWAFFSAPQEGEWTAESLAALTTDHTAIPGFRVSGALVEALRATGGFESRCWRGAGDADVVMAMRLAAPFGPGMAEAAGPLALVHEGRKLVLYGEIQGVTDGVVEALGPMVGLVGRLVATMLAAHEDLRREEQLKAYFSPKIRSLVAHDPGGLKPRVLTCTVLFCDRRASSLVAESARTAEEILAQLGRNQEILGRVAETIFREEGSVVDFTGDCVLGIWGWPIEGAHATQAVAAARAIVEELADLREYDRDLQRWFPACRIGVSTGPMAVGNVGPPQQMKFSVFGNPVNFGSRLEGLGKKFRVPVLLSQDTADAVRGVDGVLVRRLCLLRPAGFERAYPIYELVLPRDCVGSGATPEQVALYEEALGDFERRDWISAHSKLRLLSEDDELAFWLEKEVEHRQDNTPPPEWQGEIHMTEK